MAIMVATASAISAVALAGTDLFPIALAWGTILTGSCIAVLIFHPENTAMFLIGQPAVFFSWYASPLLSVALESMVIIAFLVSMGDIGGRSGIVSAILLVSVPGLYGLFISRHTHVFIPLVLLLFVCIIITLAVLGIASHLIHRVTGGLHEAFGRQ